MPTAGSRFTSAQSSPLARVCNGFATAEGDCAAGGQAPAPQHAAELIPRSRAAAHSRHSQKYQSVTQSHYHTPRKHTPGSSALVP
jgi:hypothetical protein